MEIHTQQNHTESDSQALSNFIFRDFDEIPTFEEAFDPISLRKFFQEHESTNSQSVFSPRKEISIIGDTQSQGTDEPDSLFSPFTQTLSKAKSCFVPQSSSFNFNLGSKIFNTNQLSPGKNVQKSFSNPFTQNQFPNELLQRSVSKKTPKSIEIFISKEKLEEIQNNSKKLVDTQRPIVVSQLITTEDNRVQINQMHFTKKQEDRLERLIRCKKVFKILRKPASQIKPLNTNRKLSAPMLEEFAPSLKKIKYDCSTSKKTMNCRTNFQKALPIFEKSSKLDTNDLCNTYLSLTNKIDKKRNLFDNFTKY